jgi:hypothetical protein
VYHGLIVLRNKTTSVELNGCSLAKKKLAKAWEIAVFTCTAKVRQGIRNESWGIFKIGVNISKNENWHRHMR